MTTEDLEERAARILRGASDGSPIGDLTAALDAVERLREERDEAHRTLARLREEVARLRAVVRG